MKKSGPSDTSPSPLESRSAGIISSAPSLTDGEMARYGRHLIMPEVTIEGQLKLKTARVLLVGAGGLGAPVALYLAASGVGRLGIVDCDRVDLSNLHRQVAFGTSDVGRPKLDALVERLNDLNPGIEAVPHAIRLGRVNVLEVLSAYDVVIDGTDNFDSRYLVNDACVRLGKPDVYGGVFRFEGQASVFGLEGGPCYRCLYPEPPEPGAVPACAEAGVLGVLPGVIGSILATETIKLILGRGEILKGRLLLFDALRMSFRELKVEKNPDCPVCGPRRTTRELPDEPYPRCLPEESAPNAPRIPEITPLELKSRLDSHRKVFLLDVREPFEYQICRLDACLVPLAQLPGRVGELDPSLETVVYCHTGVRSATAVEFLRRVGFEHVWNLRGGIDAWAEEIEPTMPRY